MYTFMILKFIFLFLHVLSVSASINVEVSSKLVNPLVEFLLVELLVSSGILIGSLFNPSNVSFCWLIVVFFSVLCQSSFKFVFVNLSVMVGVNISEDFIRFLLINTISLNLDLDSRSSGNEGKSGEFHLQVLFIIFSSTVINS